MGRAWSGARWARAAMVAMVAAATLASCTPATIDSPDGVTVWMDVSYSQGFFSLPWPNDIRKTDTGNLNLLGFPGTESSAVLFALASLSSSQLKDFGTQTAVYLRLTGAIDPSTLPSPEQSTEASSSVQLIDLDHPSTRVPVIVRIEPSDAERPSNLLSLLPYPGHTLTPDTRYAAVVTSGVHDTSGAPLAEAPVIAALDEDTWLGRARSQQDWLALRAQRDTVRAALAGGTAGALVGFTVFRTADSTREMRAVAAAIDALPAPVLPALPTDCEPGYLTTIDLPNFQAGTYPYTSSGGGIQVGADGKAVLQGYRTYPVVIRMPCGEAPSTGWPIETFIDGTGGSANLGDAIGFVPDAIAASIPPLFGAGTGITDPSYPSYFYNAYNPEAARSNPIQQAGNNLALIKALQHLEFSGPYGGTTPRRVDPHRVMISGESQGAQTLPLVAAMNPDVVAVLSGAGSAGFYNQVAYRRDVREELGKYAGTGGLDIRNPLVQLISTLEDLAEPANYPNDANYLNFAGQVDGCVPLESSRHLAAALKLTVADPQWGSIFGSPSLDPPTTTGPVSANVNGRTKVSIEAPGGHGTAYANPAIATDFTTAAFAGVAPTVRGPYFGINDLSCAPRWGTIGDGL